MVNHAMFLGKMVHDETMWNYFIQLLERSVIFRGNPNVYLIFD